MEEQEQELKRLRRQHRILINDKHALKGAFGMKAMHQKKLLQSMRQELGDLNLIHARSKRISEDRQLVSKVRSLIRAYESHDHKIHIQNEKTEEINKQIREMEKKINNLRQHDVYNKDEMEDLEVKVNLAKSENKLETQIKHYCAILAVNKQLREEVMSLLKDRQLFNEKYNKLVKDLALGKRQLIETMDSAKSVYDQREESLQKLNSLFVKSKSIYTNHIEEMADMKRHLDTQTQLGKFMRSKGCSRIMADLERKENEKRQTAWDKQQQQLQSHMRMVEEIRNFFGETDINRITTIFVRKENENFALFNYVNILNGEIDALTEETQVQETKIELQKKQQEEDSEQQVVSVKEFEDILTLARGEAENTKMELEKSESNFKEIIEEFENTFKILNCESSPLNHLLGKRFYAEMLVVSFRVSLVEGDKINKGNVLAHLEIFDGKLASLMTKNF